MKSFPHYTQLDSQDCGPTCLKIIAKYYNVVFSLKSLKKICQTTLSGTNLTGLSEAAEQMGFRSLKVKLPLDDLVNAPLPCILYWNNKHYVVLYKVTNRKFFISDPAYGLIKYTKEEFTTRWGNNGFSKQDVVIGMALLLEPTPSLYNQNSLEEESKNLTITYLSKYLLKYQRFLFQLFLGLIASSLIQLVLPFLTQSIVDIGISNQDISFIYLILFAQLALFFGRITIKIVRSWILLHLSSRLNISLVSDFFVKLMKLPISYFDTQLTGDILQRINDHKRIEAFLTQSSLDVLFSVIHIVVFGFVLFYYSSTIFTTFFILSVLYFIWVTFFLKKRREIDYKRFSQVSVEQSKVIELINGMQEIKTNNAERQKRWDWEFIQIKLFKISIKGLKIEQYQQVGSDFINELKNILITAIAAKLVIDGELTLGMLLAISYIVGQLNVPIAQLVVFLREWQDASISLERLSEIHNITEEEGKDYPFIPNKNSGFKINELSFRYIGTGRNVLEKLNLEIPSNKITAIVGVSGSGKTTLMKLLLKFYEPSSGKIEVGNMDLNTISHKHWRASYGVVMQEGFIFNDTIEDNITIGEEDVDLKRLNSAIYISNLSNFIDQLPLGLETKIGNEGVGISTGQKQRILIARAVYKNPQYLFFDEATSALDAENENVIMRNLNDFFESKTVLIIAHRLSTVKKAHQILVLENGRIAEIGNHETLIGQRGKYYELIKNQLELGK